MSGLVPLIQLLYYAFYPWLLIRSEGKGLTRSKIEKSISIQSTGNKHLKVHHLKQTFADTPSKAGSVMHNLLTQCQPTPGIVNYSRIYPDCCV